MKKGFTLIELLVAISILAVLSTLVLANLNSARERGRDARRKSDFHQIKTALRLYYNDNQAFPADIIFGSAWTPYMNEVPFDPLNVGLLIYSYTYVSDNEYFLIACLENANDENGIEVEDDVCMSEKQYQITQD